MFHSFNFLSMMIRMCFISLSQVMGVRSVIGTEFRTDNFWSGPLVRNSVPTFFGPVRWYGIPDRTKLVRIFGTEFRTKVGPETIIWSGPDF